MKLHLIYFNVPDIFEINTIITGQCSFLIRPKQNLIMTLIYLANYTD